MEESTNQKPIKKFIKGVGKKVKKYFGKDKGCVICLGDDGIFYGEGIYKWLKKEGVDLNIAFMEVNGEGLKEEKIKERKVLVVDNDIISGESCKKVKEFLREKKEKLKIKDIKFAVLCDRTGLADFSVEGYSAFALFNLKEIDGLDFKIIKSLKEDGRKSFVEVAKETGLTSAGIKKRVEKLIKEGVFGIRSVLSLEKFYNASCQIQINSDEKTISQLIEKFENHPFVYHIVRTVGKYNLLVSIATPNFKNIETFIEKEIRDVSDVKGIEISMGELPVIPKTFYPPNFSE